MKDLFLAKFPTAKISQYSSSNGDVIVMVNSQTAYNKEDRHNASNWLMMMENAYYRSLN